MNIKVIIFFIFLSLIFSRGLFTGKFPIPSDTLVGLYNPFRDLYAKEYPRGIPFKNFLITDPIRQQIPWRSLAIDIEKKYQIPTWNPYNFSGTPLLANFQTGAFYPLNVLLFISPFIYAWTLLIILQPILGGIFMYLYLRKLKLLQVSSLMGGIVFAFSGSSIAWMQWNTIFHVVMWLPLILLAKEQLLEKKSLKWFIIFAFAQLSAIFAGHLQTLFYCLIISNIYLLVRIWQIQKGKIVTANFMKMYTPFLIVGVLVLLVASVQWFPTFKFIQLSARSLDQADWHQAGWFIPWQHLVQFIAPDFFGNPATLNYWGTWNYAEFMGYVGIVPLLFVFYAILLRRDKKTLFYSGLTLAGLLLATQNFFSEAPFHLSIPFISTSQPTRLLIPIDFSLAILSALGMDLFMKKEKKQIYIPILLIGSLLALLWLCLTAFHGSLFTTSLDNIAVAKRNLILPSLIFIGGVGIVSSSIFFPKFKQYIYYLLILITIFDLFKVGDKFLPFTPEKYLFPNTKTIAFLQKNTGDFRIMSTDDRILPPNFSVVYKIPSVDGYDPLYLRRYAELIAASERGRPDIHPPFGFNRIITPKNYNSKIIDLLGVKYVLSLSDISSPKLKKVFQEGETRVYENVDVMPRSFFVEDYDVVTHENDRDKAINILFEQADLKRKGVVEYDLSKNLVAKLGSKKALSVGSAVIMEYRENKVVIKTRNEGEGLLVFTDSFYPTWKVTIDEKISTVQRVDYNFRGVFVPEGQHIVEFYNTLF